MHVCVCQCAMHTVYVYSRVVQYAYYSISMIVRLVVVYYAYASTSVH